MRPQVILRHCETYDPDRIAKILTEGMAALDVSPHGRVLVKPNLVTPHRHFFAHSFTRPEFMDGLLQAVKARGAEIAELSVGERSGMGTPSRLAFANAGYRPVLRRHRARAIYFDEVPAVPVQLSHPCALRSLIYVPRPVTRCDFLVNAPKFKAHSLLKVTFALKNYIGLQDDAHRVIDHDFKLANKIVDLQETLSPGFIAVDAIVAGEYCEMAPHPFSLGLIVMGVNPVAVDAVCTHIAGLDPAQVEYIRLAAERGYGPLDLAEIDVSGDVTLQEARKRAQGFCLTLARADGYLNGRSSLTAYVGPPPGGGDYCSGGCPGALLEATQVLEAFQPDVLREVRPMSFIVGAYRGDVRPGPEEPVLALGDCASWRGQIDGQQVEIDSVYVPREQRDPNRARAKDAFGMVLHALANLLRQRGQPVLCVRGCPVGMMELFVYFGLLGKTVSPTMHPRIAPAFVYHYVLHKIARAIQSVSFALQGRTEERTV
jgi:uncharacterized protein (DUF362 family)